MAHLSAVTSEAALLEAAESCRRVEDVVAVNPDGASLVSMLLNLLRP
jgi:hypothetical protein